MNRRNVFLISTAFFFAAFFAVSADSASAQTQMYVARTGSIKVLPGQTLRLTATNVGSEPVTIRFRTSKFSETVTGNIVRMQRVSQTVSDAITIEPDQAAGTSEYYIKIDVIEGDVMSTSPDLKLTAFIIGPAASGSGGSSSLPMEQISFNFTNITFEYY